jgi:hypothetical protein
VDETAETRQGTQIRNYAEQDAPQNGAYWLVSEFVEVSNHQRSSNYGAVNPSA